VTLANKAIVHYYSLRLLIEIYNNFKLNLYIIKKRKVMLKFTIDT